MYITLKRVVSVLELRELLYFCFFLFLAYPYLLLGTIRTGELAGRLFLQIIIFSKNIITYYHQPGYVVNILFKIQYLQSSRKLLLLYYPYQCYFALYDRGK